MNVEGWYFLTILFFFCIITNSLHPASNYIWIGFFFSFVVPRKSFSCQFCVWCVSAWLLIPISLSFKLSVYIYIYCCFLSEMCVYADFLTFLSRGAGAPLETSKWAVLQRKRFSLLFLCCHFCCPGGLCFFTCPGNGVTLGSGLPFGFLTAAATKSVCKLWQMVQVERTEQSI